MRRNCQIEQQSQKKGEQIISYYLYYLTMVLIFGHFLILNNKNVNLQSGLCFLMFPHILAVAVLKSTSPRLTNILFLNVVQKILHFSCVESGISVEKTRPEERLSFLFESEFLLI